MRIGHGAGALLAVSAAAMLAWASTAQAFVVDGIIGADSYGLTMDVGFVVEGGGGGGMGDVAHIAAVVADGHADAVADALHHRRMSLPEIRRQARESCGAAVTLSRDAASVADADRLVVPGVGAFGDCMAALRERGLEEAVRRHAASGRPWLGICVGMQMMLNASEEFGTHRGLGLIAGRCRPISPVGAGGQPHKVPHIGWTALAMPPARADWSGTILAGTPAGTAVYFVHSFAAEPDDRADRLADVDYDGLTLAAALARDNLAGTQFHPEKSGPAGLRILERFLAL